MNCLDHVTGRRTFGLAVVFALLTLPNASAQITFPSNSGPVTSSPAATTIESGRLMVGQARSAMARGNMEAAIKRYLQVAQLAPKLPEIVPDVARLRLDLQIAGVDSSRLSSQAQAAPTTPLPAITSATPIQNVASSPADRKREALRLVAVGRAALDRGDAATAIQFARRAQALKVPEKDFAAGEPRVWQFVLDAESAARRNGISLASDGSTPSNSIQTAGGVYSDSDVAQIKQMMFDSSSNPAGSQVKQVQAEEVYTQPLDAAGGDAASYGERLYYAGLDALQAGDQEAARVRFTQAWEYESQLDLSVRRQLKDKLSLLSQPKRLPTTAAEMQDLSPIRRAEAESLAEAQKLYREISMELAKVNEKSKSSPLDALDQLNRLRRQVDNANVSEDARRSLGALVDRSLASQKQYVEANRATIEQDLRNEAIRTEMASEDERDARADEEIAVFVDTFNDYMEQRRYAEAEVVAKQVSELKPGSQIATQMRHNALMGTRRLINEEIAAGRERVFNDNMLDVERAASEGFHPDLPMTMPDPLTWRDLTLRRLQDRNEDSRLSSAEREIKRKLEDNVKVNYRQQPLAEVVNDLSKLTGVPIVMDKRALTAIRVTPTDPVDLEVPNGISLKSALNLILRQLDLTYDIGDDVLSITSVEAKRAKVYPVTYRVTDLVTPIPNFTTSYEDGLAGALRAAYQMSNPQTDVQIMPVSMTDLASGAANSMQPSRMNPSMLGQYAPMGSQGGFGPSNPTGGGRGGGSSFADFGSLMSLIETTVVPDTWEALGGPSTMAPYPQNLSLVISTTSDVHDQIVDLLESLRALQNLQITIEVRFITLSDTFFEQIGVDFDVQFDDNTTALPQEDSGPGVSIGWDGISGLPTADLDITFNNNSFGVTPPFGAPDAGAISSIGFAILSDIEAFFFLQAAQGDNRNNVMQAPKVTLFDGQIASISDVTQRPFVTSITPVVGDFAVAQQPVIVVLNEGTQLNVQGIVSDDKRFVRLTLVPFFSQIGDVNTFTFEGRRNTRTSSRDENGDTNGDGVVNDDDAVDTNDQEDVIEGTTVQLPTFAFTQVSTTVSVPDGGTILLGGIKRLAEGRAERGVPMLSKIPYLSRLFRNVAVGRDARSLMLMVTPRIIIQEEEEIAQTGFEANR